MGHLNGIFARVGGNLNNNFQKVKCPGGCPGGMLKLRFDRYITFSHFSGKASAGAPDTRDDETPRRQEPLWLLLGVDCLLHMK